MKRPPLIIACAALLTACAGGGGTSAEDPTTADSTLSVVGTVSRVEPPKELEATIGDGTTMHNVELITDQMDTLYVEIENGSVAGGLAAGERIDLLYRRSEDALIAIVAVNISALQHLWTQTRSTGGTQSIELNAAGHAITHNMQPADYQHWALQGGQLLLTCPPTPGVEQSGYTDTFDIMLLTTDTLVISNNHGQQIFWREN